MFAQMRLGRHSPQGVTTPQLYSHLRKNLPIPADSIIPQVASDAWILGMNDKIGDCTIVACANAILAWTTANGSPYRVTDADILARYEMLSGYTPGQSDTDTGIVETDVLYKWSNAGWDIGRQNADVVLWARIDPKNPTSVRQTIHFFGGMYIGLNLPICAQTQDVWEVPPDAASGDATPGSWGGHAVYVVGYDAAGLTCVTWGRTQNMSWDFFNTYCDEAYALLDRGDWLNTKGLDPDMIDFDTLAAELKTLGG